MLFEPNLNTKISARKLLASLDGKMALVWRDSFKGILLCAALVAILVNIQEIIFFFKTGSLLRPSFYGDQAYYVNRLWTVLKEGGPIASPYYLEHVHDAPYRFVIFDYFFGTLGKLYHFNSPWSLIVVIRTTIALLVWWIAYRIFNLIAKRQNAYLPLTIVLPWAASLLVCSFFLVSWFFPILLGCALLSLKMLRKNPDQSTIPFLLLCSLLSAVHPILFASCQIMFGLAWLFRIAQAYRTTGFKTEVFGFVLWSIYAILLLLFFYAAFITAGHITPETVDTYMRNAQTTISRLNFVDINWLFPLSAFGAWLLAYALRLRPCPQKIQLIWAATVLIALAAASQSHIITGKYFLGDHFLHLAWMFSMVPLIILMTIDENRHPKGLLRLAGWLATFGLLLTAAAVPLGLMKGVSLGRILSAVIWSATDLARYSYAILAILTALGLIKNNLTRLLICIGITITGTAFTSGIALQSVQQFASLDGSQLRLLVDKLNQLPPGVIMSDINHAGWLSWSTRNFLYYSPDATMDTMTTDEITRRYADSAAIFGWSSSTRPCWLNPNSDKGMRIRVADFTTVWPYVTFRYLTGLSCRGGSYKWPNRMPNVDLSKPSCTINYLLVDKQLNSATNTNAFLNIHQPATLFKTQRYTLYGL